MRMKISAAFAGYFFAPLALASRIFLVVAGLCLIPSPDASEVILVVNLVGLAIAAAEKVVKSSFDAHDHRELIDSVLEESTAGN